MSCHVMWFYMVLLKVRSTEWLHAVGSLEHRSVRPDSFESVRRPCGWPHHRRYSIVVLSAIAIASHPSYRPKDSTVGYFAVDLPSGRKHVRHPPQFCVGAMGSGSFEHTMIRVVVCICPSSPPPATCSCSGVSLLLCA